jgi:hypothetical protein
MSADARKAAEERLVRKYNEAAYKYMVEMATALGGGE